MQIAETVAPDVSREGFAHWIASQHLDIDSNLVVVYYLPTGAPAREVRLIEVNQSLALSNRAGPFEALDFSVDVDGLERFTVLVAEVTPSEWEALTKKELAPPCGWSLESRVAFGRPETD